MNQKVKWITSMMVSLIMITGGFVMLAQISAGQNKVGTSGKEQESVSNYAVLSYVKSISAHNMSDMLSFGFYQWLNRNGYTIENFINYPSSIILSDLVTFLNENSAYKAIFNRITAEEETSFIRENHREMKMFISTLNNKSLKNSSFQSSAMIIGNKQVKGYNLKTHNGTATVFKITSDSLPGAICTDYGEWLMVSVNYFKYSLIFTTITDGQHDTLNAVYLGNSAQNFFNHANSASNDEAILEDVIIFVLGVGVSLLPFTIGLSGVAAVIIDSVLAAIGVALSIESISVSSKLLNLYESTYANEKEGKKYLWLFDSVNYFYPLQSFGVGSLDSSIGEYGYLSNGNTVTIFPNVPVIASDGVEGIIYISDISGYINNIANIVGWNTWAYQGCYSN